MSPAVLRARALEMYEEAQAHKRLANLHKRRCATGMERFNQFRRELEAMGIQVIIETRATDQAKGGPTSDRYKQRAP
jgi:aminoglycoside/choline kinase family phosphotransferase